MGDIRRLNLKYSYKFKYMKKKNTMGFFSQSTLLGENPRVTPLYKPIAYQLKIL
jgi:hypothetical protein